MWFKLIHSGLSIMALVTVLHFSFGQEPAVGQRAGSADYHVNLNYLLCTYLAACNPILLEAKPQTQLGKPDPLCKCLAVANLANQPKKLFLGSGARIAERHSGTRGDRLWLLHRALLL